MKRIVIVIASVSGTVWLILLLRFVFWAGSDSGNLWLTISWIVTMGALLWLCRDLQRTQHK
jgi:hypothetical protein